MELQDLQAQLGVQEHLVLQGLLVRLEQLDHKVQQELVGQLGQLDQQAKLGLRVFRDSLDRPGSLDLLELSDLQVLKYIGYDCLYIFGLQKLSSCISTYFTFIS